MKILQHTITASILMVTLLFVSSYYLSAQIPNNYEFLNHTNPINSPGAQMITSDGVLYVSHGILNTEILIAGTDNNLTSLENIGYSSQSKIYEINDSTYQIILYSLVDYDVFVPGIIAYTIIGNEVQTQEHTLREEYNNFVEDFERLPNGEAWVSRSTNLLKVSSDFEIIESFDMSVQNIFLDSNGRIYSHTNFGGNPRVLLFNGSEFETVDNIAVPITAITDISESGQFKFLLLRNEVRRYNADFTELLSIWPVSDKVRSFRQIEFNQDHLLVAYTADSNFIERLNYNGTVDQIWTTDQETTPGEISHILSLSDSTFLTSGIYNLLDTRQTFFRTVESNTIPNYNRTNVNLNSVAVIQTIISSTFLGVNMDGDSIFSVLAENDFDFELENLGPYPVAEIPIYGPKLFPFGSDSTFLLIHKDSINTQEVSRIQFIAQSNFSFQDITFGIPGVDLRFNQGSTSPVDFTSSIENIFDETSAIYPNPTSNVLYLPELSSSVSVFNTNGQLVIQRDNISSHQLDVSQLQSGMYNLIVQSLDSKEFHAYKFVKR